ncbi:hypothetical protein N836_30415 [Leptolyngbya sp. Heron Island J]|uniref:DUF4255 domain-containing protein n=1 Tax=Leptolyngbya sp. Heron Island J TaxID=1385935 RepID=UPI0003B9EAF3|nr:DUF4255 domain-containing protein [Leptolyngbya sp. Heron Island J]ESA38844.1 hypothetical protein N836_30415 [Leptolyngbya sp. Heron Island J]
MSNHLAIATVTAVLNKLLQEGISQDVPGAQITTQRPDAPGGNVAGARINAFLYHATPNTAWRNADIRTRRPKGDLVKHGQASLDLHYILTFYGNEQRLEPQRLMGSSIQTLVDSPLITQEMIRETVSSSTIQELEGSTLAEQVQLVKFFPSDITTEELSRVWSVFFQIPYSLSFAYQATAVVIQGRKPGKSPLPVRSRRFFTSPVRPVLTKVSTPGSLNTPITLDSHLFLQGRQLQSGQTSNQDNIKVQVQLGQARLTPQHVSKQQVEITLPTLSSAEKTQLRAGAQGIRVAHVETVSDNGNHSQDFSILSNLVPIILCPTILSAVENEPPFALDLTEIDDGVYDGQLSLRVDITVAAHQSTYLLLNDQERDTQVYVGKGERRTTDTNCLTFPLKEIRTGTYLVRVQIDGAESPLEVDSPESENPMVQRYIGPTVTIGAAI